MGIEAVPIRIEREVDVLTARKTVRAMAARLGFDETETILIATAISEIARNILNYARCGEILFETVQEGPRRGIVSTARDEGPGIADVERAMQDGFSTGGGLGLGLPGARRIMDDFSIDSRPGAGTTIIMKKWKR
jgi:serine/threonine-protein kinase RsbT